MSAEKPVNSAVGVIGLGIIGSRVAANLRRAGYPVWLWSCTSSAPPPANRHHSW